jgi:hypothetical protein
MLHHLLLACTAPSTSDAEDTGDTGAGTADTVVAEVSLWTKYKVDSASTLRGVYASDTSVYVVGSRGQAWVGSATEAWAPYTLPVELTGVDINALWGSGSGDTLQLAVAADHGLVGTLNAGVWTVATLGTGANLALDGTALTNLFVAGDNGIQRFDGTRWTLESETAVTMNAVYVYDGGAFAAGNEGFVTQRAGDGTWAESETNKAANFFGLNGVGAYDVWVAGDQGVVLHWDGTTWAQVASGTTETLNAIYTAPAGRMVAVGNDGVTLAYDGTSWSPLYNETNQNLYAVHGVSGANVWTVGNGGLTMQYLEE